MITAPKDLVHLMRFPLLSLPVLVVVASWALASDDWPQFRGPGGEGHSTAKGVPLTWSETDNIAWKTAVEGKGWSSPVVIGEQVWMTTALATLATADEAERHLASLPYAVPSPEVARSITLKAVCLDRSTGRLLRSLTLFEVVKPFQICSVNSYASPTPVAEPGRLYCDFGSMGTACLDMATGEVLWKRKLAAADQVGPASSAILHGEKLILVRDGCDVQYVIALNKHTGETIWKTDRPPIDTDFTPYKKAFSTPLIIRSGEEEQMIVPGAQVDCLLSARFRGSDLAGRHGTQLLQCVASRLRPWHGLRLHGLRQIDSRGRSRRRPGRCDRNAHRLGRQEADPQAIVAHPCGR